MKTRNVACGTDETTVDTAAVFGTSPQVGCLVLPHPDNTGTIAVGFATGVAADGTDAAEGVPLEATNTVGFFIPPAVAKDFPTLYVIGTDAADVAVVVWG